MRPGAQKTMFLTLPGPRRGLARASHGLVANENKVNAARNVLLGKMTLDFLSGTDRKQATGEQPNDTGLRTSWLD